MDTLYWLIEPTGHIETKSVFLPAEPSLDDLRFIAPLIQVDTYNFEHVTVLYANEPRDMFVDDEGALKQRPINPLATQLYIQNTMWRHLSLGHTINVRDFSPIHGPAIFFPNRRVWF